MTPFSLSSSLAPVLPTRFDSLFRDLERELDGLLGGGALTTSNDTDLPVDPRIQLGSVDIRETDKDYQFVVDVPGATNTDVKVRVSSDRILTIEGERKDEVEEDENGYRRRERFVGKWERRFQLPENTDPEHIQAKVENGVLKVIVPKTEKHEQQGTEVPVQ